MIDQSRLESLTVAVNLELYARSVGLPYDHRRARDLSRQLREEYRRVLSLSPQSYYALDGLADAIANDWDEKIETMMDNVLIYANATADGAVVNWRNWKRAERETDSQGRLLLLSTFLQQSTALTPLIESRYADLHALYAEHFTTPLDVFARRERVAAKQLRQLILTLGDRCQKPFFEAVEVMATRVFSKNNVTYPDLHALYLNRMYEPFAPFFTSRDPLKDIRTSFSRLGFNIDNVTIDFEDRPNKYAGAFCFPVHVPQDVRISVRPVSPHHLADMLFHEFGHAVHFAGIEPNLPFIDRYWIHAGTHETFATLFECLLGSPDFLCETLGFDDSQAQSLAEFTRFKFLLTCTWLAASGMAVCDAWIDSLSWSEVEKRYIDYIQRFTGIPAPLGSARLDPYVNKLDPYVLGYLVAAVRVSHWLNMLEARWGKRWWTDPASGDSIRNHIRLGGAVHFEENWLEPLPFANRWRLND